MGRIDDLIGGRGDNGARSDDEIALALSRFLEAIGWRLTTNRLGILVEIDRETTVEPPLMVTIWPENGGHGAWYKLAREMDLAEQAEHAADHNAELVVDLGTLNGIECKLRICRTRTEGTR